MSRLYQGAVASAFNHGAQAQKLLGAVIAADPHSQQAYEAHEILTYLFLRNGRYKEAVSESEAKWAARPEKAVQPEERAFISAFAGLRNQSVLLKRTVLPYTIHDGNMFVPVSVNGKAAKFMIDTGANFSLISESVAQQAGMTIHQTDASMFGIAGNKTVFRTAVAERLSIGTTVIENAMFLVSPDTEPPFADAPIEERGILGMPILLAMRSMRWDAHQIEFGLPSTGPLGKQPNLCFDGSELVTQAAVEGKGIELILDTGAAESNLWPPFAKKFQSILKSGTKSVRTLNGSGASAELEDLVLPQIKVMIGEREVVFSPAHVLLQSTTPSSEWYDGRLGFDLLSKEKSASLDFENMILTLQ